MRNLKLKQYGGLREQKNRYRRWQEAVTMHGINGQCKITVGFVGGNYLLEVEEESHIAQGMNTPRRRQRLLMDLVRTGIFY